MKIERHWFAEDVRRMCIRNDYCNRCDKDTYQEILNFVKATLPTDDNMITLARLISYGTDRGDISVEGYMQHVLFELLNNCIHYLPTL